MTPPDAMQLLIRKSAEMGQAAVARALGYSPSAVNQALKGNYKGDLTNMLRRVTEVFGQETVDCPVLREITLAKCAEHRKRPFAATNPLRVRLYRECQKCQAKNGKGDKP